MPRQEREMGRLGEMYKGRQLAAKCWDCGNARGMEAERQGVKAHAETERVAVREHGGGEGKAERGPGGRRGGIKGHCVHLGSECED